MANAGRVELDLVAVGKDEVSAMLRKVEAQARQMATGMKEAGTATAGVGAKLEGLKESVKPLDKVRSVFENLRSNAMFVVAGVGALAGAFVALSEAVSTNARALREWDEASKKIYEGIGKPPKLLDEIAEFLGEKVTTPGMRMMAQIQESIGTIEKQIEDAKAGAVALQRAYDEVLAGGIKAGEVDEELARKRNGAQSALAALEEQRRVLLERQEDVQKRITQELEQQGRLSKNVVDDMVDVLAKLAQAGAKLSDGAPGLASRLFGKGTGTGLSGAPKPPRGGAPRVLGDQRGDFFGQSGGVSGRFATNDAPSPFKEVDEALLSMFSEGGAAESGGDSPLARMATDAEKLRDALQHVADAASLVAHTMPEMGAALGEVQAITAQVVDGKMQLTEALAAGATAIAANAAKAIGGVRAEAAVRAAYEVGMGFATIANPIVSAGHFTAAALLGAVAAGAGGGGGGGRAGGSSMGERADSGGSGGPSTIVYNFSSLVTDQQQVTTALRRAGRSSRGTGHESRAGV